jgi:hypothetical protein
VQHLFGVRGRARDEQPQPGPLLTEDLERLEQDGQALAGLVETSEEADRAAGSRPARRVATPFGMTTASPPMCSTSVVRAASDTAIRPLIFSIPVRTTG